VAVGLLAIATGVGAAVIPALIAARRDPLKELRVP
jgi:putative ABC transport system permease protein